MCVIYGIASILAGDKNGRGTYKIVFDSAKMIRHHDHFQKKHASTAGLGRAIID